MWYFGENRHIGFHPLILPLHERCSRHLGENWPYTKESQCKPRGLRLYYSNDYLGSVGVHLSALVWNWLESLLGFIGLEAQTLTNVIG